MKIIGTIFYLLIIPKYFCAIYGLRSFAMDFETSKYEFNSKIVKMNLTLVDFQNHKAINGSVLYLEDVDKFNIMIWAKSVRSNRGRSMTLLNVTLNGCDFLANKWSKANVLTSVTVAEMRKNLLGMPSKCPLKKNSEVIVNRIMLNEEIFPPYLPDLNFDCFFGLTQGKTDVFKIWQTGYIASKNGELYRKKKLKST